MIIRSKKITNKEIAIIVVSIMFFWIGGSVLEEKGFPLLQEVDNWQEFPNCSNLLACHDEPIVYIANSNGTTANRVFGSFHFNSYGSFAVNHRINYEINMDVTHPQQIDQLYFILFGEREEFGNLKNLDPDYLLAQAKNQQRLIDMQRISDTKFHREGSWAYPFPEPIYLIGLVVNDNKADLMERKQVIEINSLEEHNKAVQNVETRITNKTILGLTWIGIGLAPILVGADFIVRIVLKEHQP